MLGKNHIQKLNLSTGAQDAIGNHGLTSIESRGKVSFDEENRSRKVTNQLGFGDTDRIYGFEQYAPVFL